MKKILTFILFVWIIGACLVFAKITTIIFLDMLAKHRIKTLSDFMPADRIKKIYSVPFKLYWVEMDGSSYLVSQDGRFVIENPVFLDMKTKNKIKTLSDFRTSTKFYLEESAMVFYLIIVWVMFLTAAVLWMLKDSRKKPNLSETTTPAHRS